MYLYKNGSQSNATRTEGIYQTPGGQGKETPVEEYQCKAHKQCNVINGELTEMT